ncbi:MAG: tRNA(Glu)-specific nuclease WapA, partial [Patescibacteria group bacterium]|nr:tRNA(Glu)-specific nuclease WapA [Patescibacteria group bacterium]
THVLDANGNITKTTYPDGYFVDRAYDQLNRLSTIKLNGSATSAATFSYNQLSQRTGITFSNGTSVVYTPQLNEDLSGITHNFVGSNVAFTYGFNDVHEPLSMTVSDSTYMWHPAAAGTVTYGTADNVNKYPTVGGTGYTYNGNKCLTGDGTWTFGYDTENHVLTASKTGTSASFVYDPMHRQSQKTVGSTKTRYVYSGWQRIADYNGTSGALQRRYVYGTGLDEPLIIVTGSTPTFLHHDKMGSIIAVSNNSGAVANKNKFSPFGEITTLGGTTIGFTGQRYDSELGLYYFKHRYYSPKLGRFLQPDPIGYTSSDFNLYTYVGNSPKKYTDPMGLQICWVPGTGDPVDSYIPWYLNPNILPGADWFAQFELTFAEGIKKLLEDAANIDKWFIPPAEAKDSKKKDSKETKEKKAAWEKYDKDIAQWKKDRDAWVKRLMDSPTYTPMYQGCTTPGGKCAPAVNSLEKMYKDPPSPPAFERPK